MSTALALHRVRRLRWQARAPSAAQAFALRSLLHARSDAVQAALERECARLDVAGEVWRLPQLRLRVDAADLAQLDAALPDLVGRALREALREAKTTGRVAPESIATDAINSGSGSGNTSRSSAAHDDEALRHYLQTGHLPWALAGLPPEAQQQALRGAASRAVEQLLARGHSWAEALLIAPGAAIEARVGQMLRCLPLLTAALRQRLLAASPGPAGVPAAVRDAWQARIASGDGTAAEAIEWLALWLVWPTSAAQTVEAMTPREAADLRHWLAQRLTVAARSTTAIVPTIADLPASLLHALDRPLARTRADTATAVPPPPRRFERPGVADDEGTAVATDNALLVPLAGLVLVHPFLPRFLAGCGVLTDNGRTIDETQRPRACALLHALACGDAAEASEHQLPLIKLLLGRAPELPLTAALPRLTETDSEEVTALLCAVREHWTALASTSIEGLRLSFLQRRGLLRRADGAWQLHLQSEAFDMLLGLLPWRINLVKLPWMALPLMVEWRAP